MSKIMVRFHLGAGSNHKKWQVKIGKSIEYFDPEKFTLAMRDCKLKNHKTVAKQIHEGKNKTVCAWIECQALYVHAKTNISSPIVKVCYNPKVVPHWVENDIDVDNKQYEWLYTHERNVFRYE